MELKSFDKIRNEYYRVWLSSLSLKDTKLNRFIFNSGWDYANKTFSDVTEIYQKESEKEKLSDFDLKRLEEMENFYMEG